MLYINDQIIDPAMAHALHADTLAYAGVCGHRAHADGSSARKAADFLGCCRGRR